MWPMRRASDMPSAGSRPARSSDEDRLARATEERAMFWALSRPVAQIAATRAAPPRDGRAPTGPPACRRAIRRSPRARARFPAAASSRRWTATRSRTVNSGKPSPYGAPVSGSMLAGPVVPRQPPSRFGRDDEPAIGVDRPAGADQVVPPAADLGVAVVAGGVRVAGQRVADERPTLSRAGDSVP